MVIVISGLDNKVETYESLVDFFKAMISKEKYIEEIDEKIGTIYFDKEKDDKVSIIEVSEQSKIDSIKNLKTEVNKIKTEMKKSYKDLSLFGIDKKITEKIKNSFNFLEKK